MKKSKLFLLTILLIVYIFIVSNNFNQKYKEVNVSNNEYLMIIFVNNEEKSCIPVKLVLFEDGIFYLYNTYETCENGKQCYDEPKYLDYVLGNYKIDLKKIINNAKILKENEYPTVYSEYKIYLGKKYINDGYNEKYVVYDLNDNKPLQELLKNMNINKCANPVYK